MKFPAISLRYVDANNDICEDFVTFIKLERVRAIDIYEAITGCLEELGLSLNNLRGQGYDGASTMSGQQKIKRILWLSKDFGIFSVHIFSGYPATYKCT